MASPTKTPSEKTLNEIRQVIKDLNEGIQLTPEGRDPFFLNERGALIIIDTLVNNSSEPGIFRDYRKTKADAPKAKAASAPKAFIIH